MQGIDELTNVYCSRHFRELTDTERWNYLVRQNAFFIWERRIKDSTPGTALGDWMAAEKYVRENFS